MTSQRNAKGRFVACVHHWVLPEPNGPTSEGVCVKCGKRAAFKNAWEPRPFHLKAHQHRQPRRKT